MSAAEDPVRLEDMPTVLDAVQVRAVLRCGEKKLRTLVLSGRLRRLRYSQALLFDSREIRRFLREQSGPGEDEGSES